MAEVEKIMQRYEKAMDMLMVQYDTHMKKILPKPDLLPIRVNVVLVEQKTTTEINGVLQVRPFETIDEIID